MEKTFNDSSGVKTCLNTPAQSKSSELGKSSYQTEFRPMSSSSKSLHGKKLTDIRPSNGTGSYSKKDQNKQKVSRIPLIQKELKNNLDRKISQTNLNKTFSIPDVSLDQNKQKVSRIPLIQRVPKDSSVPKGSSDQTTTFNKNRRLTHSIIDPKTLEAGLNQMAPQADSDTKQKPPKCSLDQLALETDLDQNRSSPISMLDKTSQEECLFFHISTKIKSEQGLNSLEDFELIENTCNNQSILSQTTSQADLDKNPQPPNSSLVQTTHDELDKNRKPLIASLNQLVPETDLDKNRSSPISMLDKTSQEEYFSKMKSELSEESTCNNHSILSMKSDISIGFKDLLPEFDIQVYLSKHRVDIDILGTENKPKIFGPSNLDSSNQKKLANTLANRSDCIYKIRNGKSPSQSSEDGQIKKVKKSKAKVASTAIVKRSKAKNKTRKMKPKCMHINRVCDHLLIACEKCLKRMKNATRRKLRVFQLKVDEKECTEEPEDKL